MILIIKKKRVALSAQSAASVSLGVDLSSLQGERWPSSGKLELLCCSGSEGGG